jgi:hypothetical protein
MDIDTIEKSLRKMTNSLGTLFPELRRGNWDRRIQGGFRSALFIAVEL